MSTDFWVSKVVHGDKEKHPYHPPFQLCGNHLHNCQAYFKPVRLTSWLRILTNMGLELLLSSTPSLPRDKMVSLWDILLRHDRRMHRFRGTPRDMPSKHDAVRTRTWWWMLSRRHHMFTRWMSTAIGLRNRPPRQPAAAKNGNGGRNGV